MRETWRRQTSDGADAPAREEPSAAGTSAPADGPPAIPRRRRAPYVRLLEVERMLARLPLAEATEPAEAGLWIDALDAIIARATALRLSLSQLQGNTSPATTRGKPGMHS